MKKRILAERVERLEMLHHMNDGVDAYYFALMEWFRGHRKGPRPEPPPRSRPMPFMSWLHDKAARHETETGIGGAGRRRRD